MRRRSPEKNRSARPEYEGMGLGLFIAKTLLERSGATLRFANGSEDRKAGDRTGAVVEVNWPRRMLNTRDHEQPLGQNPQITT